MKLDPTRKLMQVEGFSFCGRAEKLTFVVSVNLDPSQKLMQVRVSGFRGGAEELTLWS